ncbi:SdrD B-like domain-containing protein [Paenibacillus sp. ACRRX]|uniref:SdrD B-like domain-containing protein n=1 Tax=Paenibacillus sp. ACRRX TaxID=2918206 RepID=UPI0023B869E2|nr:SdrD B-like domain-containing protein [Paenibacillus sp. ACRRX]
MKRLVKTQAVIWAFMLVLHSVLLPVAAYANQAGGDASGVQIKLNTTEANVLAGKTFSYEIDYSLASTTGDFANAKIVLPLPAGIEFERTIDSIHATGKYEKVGNAGTVTFTFKDPTAAGVTGRLQVNAHFPNQVTPNGTIATTNATFEHNQGSVRVKSNLVQVTAMASAEWSLKKEQVVPVQHVKPIPGSEVEYKITFGDVKDANQYGNLNIDDVIITDTLPDAATFISARPAPSKQELNNKRLTWQANAQGDFPTEIFVKVSYPANVIDVINQHPDKYPEQKVTNNAQVSYKPLGESQPTVLQSKASHGFVDVPQGGIWIYKNIYSANEKELSKGQGVSFYIGGMDNSANVELQDAKMTDMTPNGLELNYLKTPKFVGISSYKVQYTTTTHPKDDSNWSNWGAQLTTDKVHQLNAADLLPTQAADIKGIRFVFGSIPVEFRQVGALELRYSLTADYKNLPEPYVYGYFQDGTDGEPGGNFPDLDKYNGLPNSQESPADRKQIVNHAVMTHSMKDKNGNPGSTQKFVARVKVLAVDKLPIISVDKKASGTVFESGDKVTYTIKVKNAGSTNVDFENPIVRDLLPSELEYVKGSLTFKNSNGIALPAPHFQQGNPDSSGRTPLVWTWGSDNSNTLLLKNGDTLTLTFDAQINKGTSRGSITNEVEVTSVTQKYVNNYNNFKNQRYKDGKWYVYSNTAIYINSAVNLESIKWVQGDLDNGTWTKYPDTGNVTPGGEIKYKLELRNNGTVGVKNAIIVDALPHIGDHGVIDPAPRGSKWSPVLTHELSLPQDVTVYYSTDSEVSMTRGDWSKVAPQDLTTVRALRFEFGKDVILAPGESRELTWTMRAPVGAPTGLDQIAWNSFGYTAIPVGSDSFMLPAEPLKVGIKIQDNPKAEIGNYVWLDVNDNGIQDEAPASGVNGVRVTLHRAADGQLLQSTITGNSHTGDPGYYLFTGLEAGHYVVKFELPVGYEFAKKDEGTNPSLNSKADPAGITAVVALQAGDKYHDVDAGLITKKTPPVTIKGAIGKYVWLDTNSNGIQDIEESGLNNVVVELRDGRGDLLASTVTRSVYYSTVTNSVYDPTVTGSVYNPSVTDYVYKPGYYLFDQLNAGHYKVRFIVPDGYAFTKQSQGSDPVRDSNASTLGWSEDITLTEGQRNLTIDAGLVVKPTTPVDPGKPDEPGTPGKPDEPGTPGKPDEPGTPGKPDEPGTPGKPDEPGTPGKPDEPGTPGKPDQPGTPGKPSEPGNPGEDGANQPGDHTGGEHDGQDETEGGGTDVAGDNDHVKPGQLPLTGEEAPVAPIAGILLCAIAVGMWLVRKKMTTVR